MESLFRFLTAPHPCGYLPDRLATLEYEIVGQASAAEYMSRMLRGWRRFGGAMFHPQCEGCQACQSLRVDVHRFRPHRNQRRVRKQNEGVVELRIGTPRVTQTKIALYDKYHAYQTEAKGWPAHPTKDPLDYADSFVNNPFPTMEWCYYLDDRLIGIGYVDDLPGGLSAIYFFYDPEQRQRSLGTWNVLSILDHARRRGIPYLYLGYFVAGSSSMVYKSLFVPNEILTGKGTWQVFRS